MSKIDIYPNLKSPPQDAEIATGTAFPTDKFALDVNLLGGTITSSGPVHILAPTGPFKISGATVTDVASNPIPVALTGRVNVSVRNKSTTDTIFLGNASVTADNDPVTGGWEIGPGEDLNIELDDSNAFYLIAETGVTTFVKLFEIASS